MLEEAGATRAQFHDIVDTEFMSAAEWEQYYAPSGANMIGWQVEPDIGARLVASLRLQPSDVFVDLGCSTGTFCLLAALLSPVKEVIGIEISPSRQREAEDSLHRLKVVAGYTAGLQRVRFLQGNFEFPSDSVQDALSRATVVYYAANRLSHFDAATGQSVGPCVEKVPVLKWLRPQTRFVSLSFLSPDFEMWREVQLVGALELGRAYSVKKRRLRLALEYVVQGEKFGA